MTDVPAELRDYVSEALAEQRDHPDRDEPAKLTDEPIFDAAHLDDRPHVEPDSRDQLRFSAERYLSQPMVVPARVHDDERLRDELIRTYAWTFRQNLVKQHLRPAADAVVTTIELVNVGGEIGLIERATAGPDYADAPTAAYGVLIGFDREPFVEQVQ